MKFALAILIAGSLVLPGQAAAQSLLRPGGGLLPGPVVREVQRAERVDLQTVVQRLRASREGRMLGASERTQGGRSVYVIRWEYPGGRVVDIIVDARTGAVIGEN